MDRQSQKAIDAGRAAHERLCASSDPIISAHAKSTGYLADDNPGLDGETLRRQRLPGAAERWEALPWENRMSLLGGLAEEAAQHRREADFAASTAMQERYAALATTWETAHAALMRADTVSSKDKSQEEVAAERTKYAAPLTPETVLRATIGRLRDAINNPPDGDDDAWRSAMRAALREHEAAIAGTTPVVAPAVKEQS